MLEYSAPYENAWNETKNAAPMEETTKIVKIGMKTISSVIGLNLTWISSHFF